MAARVVGARARARESDARTSGADSEKEEEGRGTKRAATNGEWSNGAPACCVGRSVRPGGARDSEAKFGSPSPVPFRTGDGAQRRESTPVLLPWAVDETAIQACDTAAARAEAAAGRRAEVVSEESRNFTYAASAGGRRHPLADRPELMAPR